MWLMSREYSDFYIKFFVKFVMKFVVKLVMKACVWNECNENISILKCYQKWYNSETFVRDTSKNSRLLALSITSRSSTFTHKCERSAITNYLNIFYSNSENINKCRINVESSWPLQYVRNYVHTYLHSMSFDFRTNSLKYLLAIWLGFFIQIISFVLRQKKGSKRKINNKRWNEIEWYFCLKLLNRTYVHAFVSTRYLEFCTDYTAVTTIKKTYLNTSIVIRIRKRYTITFSINHGI